MIYVNLSRKHMKCAKKFWRHGDHSRLVKITSERTEAMWNVICIFLFFEIFIWKKKIHGDKNKCLFYVISSFFYLYPELCFWLTPFYFLTLILASALKRDLNRVKIDSVRRWSKNGRLDLYKVRIYYRKRKVSEFYWLARSSA